MTRNNAGEDFLHYMLQYPINMAHALDRKADHFMSLNPPNYLEAIRCHQAARRKIDEVLMGESPEQQGSFRNGPKKPLLVSLYGQKERHIYMQKVILSKQQTALEQCKQTAYTPTVREKKTEAALLNAHELEKKRIEQTYQEQTELYDSLHYKLNTEEDVNMSIESTEARWPAKIGRKKPKSYDETIEELKGMQTHFKYLSDKYCTAIMQLKTELMTLKEEPVSPRTTLHFTANSREQMISGESLNLHSLEKPPPFELPELSPERTDTDTVLTSRT